MPAGEGANVVARVPARGASRRTLVLVAHHDAAQTGLMWRHPWLTGVQWSRDEVPPFAAGTELGFALVALGREAHRGRAARAVALRRARRRAQPDGPRRERQRDRRGRASSRSPSATPASRSRARRWSPCSPAARSRAWAGWRPGCAPPRPGRSTRASTLVLGLDTLGAGEPVVLEAEGPPRRQRYRDRDLDWADRGAERAGLPSPRRFTIGALDRSRARAHGRPPGDLAALGQRRRLHELPPADGHAGPGGLGRRSSSASAGGRRGSSMVLAQPLEPEREPAARSHSPPAEPKQHAGRAAPARST